MTKSRIPHRLRKIVQARAGGQCEYCRSQMGLSTHDFSIEHVIPVHYGGTSTLDNLASACQGCNNFKFTKTEGLDPISGLIVPLFHPRRDNWHDHFVWNHDFTRVVGRTPTGRATIETLRLNRENLVNYRSALFAAGKHPPPELDEG